MERSVSYAGAFVIFLTLFMGMQAMAQIGGQLFATGDPVEVEVLPSNAGFTSELRLFEPLPERTLALNSETGKIVPLGSFPSGTELIFGIFVQNTGNTFKMGPASRNPDNVIHAEVVPVSQGIYNVGFEDQFGGGDLDLDDNVFQFRGGILNEPTASEESIPTLGEWGVLLLLALLTGAAILQLSRRPSLR